MWVSYYYRANMGYFYIMPVHALIYSNPNMSLWQTFQVTVEGESCLVHPTRDRAKIPHTRRLPTRGHLLAVVSCPYLNPSVVLIPKNC